MQPAHALARQTASPREGKGRGEGGGGSYLHESLRLIPRQGIMAKARAPSQAVVLRLNLAADDALHVVPVLPDLRLLMIDCSGTC